MSDKEDYFFFGSLEADCDEDNDDEAAEYDEEDLGEDKQYLWCTCCFYFHGFETIPMDSEIRKNWDERQWKCNRCKPQLQSVRRYIARTYAEADKLFDTDVEINPYKQPYWLCDQCLFLHDDGYEGKCEGVSDCKESAVVRVYYGRDYEDAKERERRKRRIDGVHDGENPAKKAKIFVDLTHDDDN
jgi:hypothetical protein